MGRRQTLNARLMLLGGCAVFSLTAIVLCISYLVAQYSIEQSLISTCNTVAVRLSGALGISVWNYDLPNIHATIHAEILSPDVRQIKVMDEQGKPVAWGNRYRSGAIETGRHEPPTDTGLVSFFRLKSLPIDLNNRNIGQVVVSVSKDARMREFTSQLLQTLALQLINTLVCISVLLIGVRLLIVRRITALSQVVADFSTSGFASRMPPGPPDEIGTLANSFNSMAQTISAYSEDLEQLVKERTAQLVEAEKLAFLGGLVSGFAHELNTPLGIALTANTYQESRLSELEQRFHDGTLSKGELHNQLQDLQKSQQLVQSNLERTARLVTTLRSVGVDQVGESQTRIFLRSFLEETLYTLAAHLRGAKITVSLDIPPDLCIVTSSTAMYQIFSLLILNVVVHAYPLGSPGTVNISVFRDEGRLDCVLRDQGQGIPDELMPRVFTPFFTTRHFEGHVGLGLYIVYAAVRKLHGTITCAKPADGGLQFTLSFPLPAMPA